MGAPTVAALWGTSSNVKLTLGLVPGSRSGAMRKCLASRLLTRALNADQSGDIVHSAFLPEIKVATSPVHQRLRAAGLVDGLDMADHHRMGAPFHDGVDAAVDRCECIDQDRRARYKGDPFAAPIARPTVDVAL